MRHLNANKKLKANSLGLAVLERLDSAVSHFDGCDIGQTAVESPRLEM